MTITASQLLKVARDLIEKPENWCRDHMAVNAEGKSVSTTSEDAVAYCLIGAMIKANYITEANKDIGVNVVRDRANRYVQAVLEKMALNYGAPSITLFNDDHVHERMVELFDNAIELAKIQGD